MNNPSRQKILLSQNKRFFPSCAIYYCQTNKTLVKWTKFCLCKKKSILLQLERDTDLSFHKVEAPLALTHPKMNNKEGEIIGYKKSKIYANHYSVQKLSEVWVVPNIKCSKVLYGIFVFGQHQMCTIQKYDANENGMVCIDKEI